MNPYSLFQRTKRQRVSDGQNVEILIDSQPFNRLLVILLPQFGDFDSLEYAWWLRRDADKLRQKQNYFAGGWNWRSQLWQKILSIHWVPSRMSIYRQQRRTPPSAFTLSRLSLKYLDFPQPKMPV